MEPSRDELDFSVTVHVSGIKGQQMRWIYGQDLLCKCLRSQVFQHDNSSDFVITGRDHPRACYEQVQIAILVDVARLNMSGTGNLPIQIGFHEISGWKPV